MGYLDKIKKMLSSSTTLPESSCCSGHDHAHGQDHKEESCCSGDSHDHKHEESGCCSDNNGCCSDDSDNTKSSSGCGCC